MSCNPNNFLNGLGFYFVKKKLSKLQHEILLDKIQRFGGQVTKDINNSTTHVLFSKGVNLDSGLDSTQLQQLRLLRETISTINIEWLPRCIAQRKLLPTTDFKVFKEKKHPPAQEHYERNFITSIIINIRLNMSAIAL